MSEPASDQSLGDILRAERASQGKSLLDVQRELKIKATYISAIENTDPSAFDTPGFVAAYVRSYARYLELDPEWVFKRFCEEGGFEVAHLVSNTTQKEPSASSPHHSRGGFQESVDRYLNWQDEKPSVLRRILFVTLYPFFAILDLLNYFVSNIRGEEPGKKKDFLSVSSQTTDWWAIFSVTSGLFLAMLFYLSDYSDAVSDIPARLGLSFVIGLAASALLAWFHPKMFFARLVLALVIPLFYLSVFGVEATVSNSDGRLEINLASGGPREPIEIIVLGAVFIVAMSYHRWRD